MKHTPGPWEVDTEETADRLNAIIGGDGSIVADNIYGKEDRHEANAHLIAAAPDLLEAAKYVVDYHRKHDSGEGELFGLDYVTTCIAAITKAGV